MPIYEYLCEQDDTVIELVRSMADADNPVDDPENKGRTFRRKISVFSSSGAAGVGKSAGSTGMGGGGGGGGCCPCGKGAGACRSA